ncbi:uncharacterized protein M421DRAFT_60806, partial [Didymella exigua CBS 183.55]
AWKTADHVGHEAANTVRHNVGEALEWANEHPGETAGIVACVVAIPVAIAATGPILGAAGFTGQGIDTGSAAAIAQSAVGNIAAGCTFAILQSAEGGSSGTVIVNIVVAGTVLGVAAAATAPGLIKAVNESKSKEEDAWRADAENTKD